MKRFNLILLVEVLLFSAVMAHPIASESENSAGGNTVAEATEAASNGKKFSAFFIGNSYTQYNGLPTLVANIADGMGDTLLHEQSTPGGCKLIVHYSTKRTRDIVAGKVFDFIVLQEFSQYPVIDSSAFFTYSMKFDSLRRVYSPEGRTMFYMTWGRKNGDSQYCRQYPAVCTYEGMDSVLRVRYLEAQRRTGALISPVGSVRNYIINNYPNIELYTSDGSHPSKAGSYAAAVTFYTVMFRNDPTLATYNYSLSNSVADTIKKVVKKVVYDVLDEWNDYNNDPAEIVDNISHSRTINVYPTIAQTSITIQVEDAYSKGNYSIISTTGKELIEGVLNEDKTYCDVGSLKSGMYLIKIVVDNVPCCKKFVIN